MVLGPFASFLIISRRYFSTVAVSQCEFSSPVFVIIIRLVPRERARVSVFDETKEAERISRSPSARILLYGREHEDPRSSSSVERDTESQFWRYSSLWVIQNGVEVYPRNKGGKPHKETDSLIPSDIYGDDKQK